MPKNNPNGYRTTKATPEEAVKTTSQPPNPKEAMGTPEWRREQLLNMIPGRRTYERFRKKDK
jgi:hypothetical protein